MQRYDHYIDSREEKLVLSYLHKVFYVCLILILITTVFTAALHEKYLYSQVTNISMQPTINPDPSIVYDKDGNAVKVQDGVILDKYPKLSHGNIVVLHIPNKSEIGYISLIKRIIGFGGDYISIKAVETEEGEQFRVFRRKAGSLEVERLDESYVVYENWPVTNNTSKLYNGVKYDMKFFNVFLNGGEDHDKNVYRFSDDDNTLYYKVPEGQIFFLGDNRAESADSRDLLYKTRPVETVVGKAVYIVRDVIDINPYFTELVAFGRFVLNSIKEIFV